MKFDPIQQIIFYEHMRRMSHLINARLRLSFVLNGDNYAIVTRLVDDKPHKQRQIMPTLLVWDWTLSKTTDIFRPSNLQLNG